MANITTHITCQDKLKVDVREVLTSNYFVMINKGGCERRSHILSCMREHPRLNPERNEVEKLWPHIPVLLSAPLHQTSAVLL